MKTPVKTLPIICALILLLFPCWANSPRAFAKKPEAEPAIKGNSTGVGLKKAEVKEPERSDETAVLSDTAEDNEGVTDEETARALAASSAKVNDLANLEALLNIVANGIEILSLAIGVPTLVAVPVGIFLLFKKNMRIYGIICIVAPIVVIVVGLAAPGIINWIVASVRDSGGFR